MNDTEQAKQALRRLADLAKKGGADSKEIDPDVDIVLAVLDGKYTPSSHKRMTDGFWAEVKRSLTTDHSFSSEEADQYIDKSRHLITNDGVGDAMVHFGPEEMAEGLAMQKTRET